MLYSLHKTKGFDVLQNRIICNFEFLKFTYDDFYIIRFFVKFQMNGILLLTGCKYKLSYAKSS